jgi:hypothetical protein
MGYGKGWRDAQPVPGLSSERFHFGVSARHHPLEAARATLALIDPIPGAAIR